MITLLVFLASVLPVTQAQTPGCDAAISRRLAERLTPALQERAGRGAFSGVVLVACKGQPIYTAAHGVSNRATGAIITADTRFNLGSMNKMWTAIAIAQLVDQGKVDVESPVGRYLPDLSNQAIREKVRVRHLLTHTSGLGSYFTRGFLRDGIVINNAADLAPYFVADSLAFTPGERFQYSNAGFALLGMIVERVSGMPYFDYMQKNVLERAGMKGATFIKLPVPSPIYAIGYATPPGAAEASDNTQFLERSSSPAGGAYADAASVVAFSRALWSGKLVKMSLVKEFTTGRVDMMGAKYGYGFGESDNGGWRTVGHNGGAPGVGVEFVSFPEHDIDVVVLTNVDMPEASQVLSTAVSAITGAPERRFITRPPGKPPAGV